ncbi:hypothetical protein [Flavobacterium cerinum]|uniref:hypothetical protein n=1 Tax=Flavobacterium cerinum TaxID=2502784 RepID=UPI0013E3208A|nr:hypothetical protein [Flavobacterium cerinum]
MSVAIVYKEDGLYTINGISVYLDGNGNWIAMDELTAFERKSFDEYRRANNLS